jgi:gluconolactonase
VEKHFVTQPFDNVFLSARRHTMATIREITSGLQFPEGPVAMNDGSVLVVEIKRQTLTRISPDGTKQVVATTGGGPNGAAIGPDGKVYICNNGGFEWGEVGGLLVPGHQPKDYTSGSVQRVDLATGKVETLYTECDGHLLRGPNDLVFDSGGGFWFTDASKIRERDRDRTGVYYAKADGSLIKEVVFPIDVPNGIGLSPNGKRLYVAETFTGRVWWWDIAAPGELVRAEGPGGPLLAGPGGGTLLVGLPGYQLLDSLAVDSAGNVCVATLINGGVTVISPDGNSVEHIPTPDPVTTNLCFGGPDLRTAYVTLSGTGRLVAMEWPRPGLKLNYQ